jgi:putative SOS response-associated peptidase YedK
MCGRFTLTTSGEELAEEFGLQAAPDVVARYNIAPTQPVVVVRRRSSGPCAEWMKWGIAFPPGKGRKPPLLINARAETLGERPAWRDALWRRRCLVPADGFYEWKDVGGRTQPFYVTRRDGGPFALAGLWQPRFTPDGEASCTIVTTEPLPPVADLHDRMPLLLSRDDRALWLDEEAQRASIVKLLLTPVLPHDVVTHPVGTFVNDANNEGPGCRAPVAASPDAPPPGQLSFWGAGPRDGESGRRRLS